MLLWQLSRRSGSGPRREDRGGYSNRVRSGGGEAEASGGVEDLHLMSMFLSEIVYKVIAVIVEELEEFEQSRNKRCRPKYTSLPS